MITFCHGVFPILSYETVLWGDDFRTIAFTWGCRMKRDQFSQSFRGAVVETCLGTVGWLSSAVFNCSVHL